MEVTQGSDNLQRQVAFLLVMWMLRVRFTFARMGESPLSKKVKAHLPQITSG